MPPGCWCTGRCLSWSSRLGELRPRRLSIRARRRDASALGHGVGAIVQRLEARPGQMIELSG